MLGVAMAVWTAVLGGAIAPLLLAGSPPKGVRKVTRLWARGVLALARQIGGIDHVVEGKANVPQVPCLILCNHQSAWETIAALVLFPDVAIVAKRELLRIPVFGWYLGHSPMIIIDRAASLESIRRMARESARAVAEGRSVLIFPEGTRIDPEAPIRFKRGVEHVVRALSIPVLPVVHDAGRYWRRNGKARGTIVVRILPPLDGTGQQRRLASRAEAAMNSGRPGSEEGEANAMPLETLAGLAPTQAPAPPPAPRGATDAARLQALEDRQRIDLARLSAPHPR